MVTSETKISQILLIKSKARGSKDSTTQILHTKLYASKIKEKQVRENTPRSSEF